MKGIDFVTISVDSYDELKKCERAYSEGKVLQLSICRDTIYMGPQDALKEIEEYLVGAEIRATKLRIENESAWNVRKQEREAVEADIAILSFWGLFMYWLRIRKKR